MAISTLTPKAFANFSPGLKRSDNPGIANKKQIQTLKGFANRRTLSGLVARCKGFVPGLKRSDNPGIANQKQVQTLKGFASCRTLSGLIAGFKGCTPGFSLRSNPGLKLANAFGVSEVEQS